MKINGKSLELQKGLNREWVISNGIGGFASQTILGINTRKYHGLLVAPLDPPSRRFVILSKVDESITYEDTKEEKILYSNVCKNYISEGYKNLKSFEKVYNPIFEYEIDGIKIEKQICMLYGKNTVCVTYNIKNLNRNFIFKITPLLNFRDFHCINNDHEYILRQKVVDRKVKIIIDSNSVHPIYMCVNEGEYIKHEHDSFKNIYYIEEEKRGFYPEENLAISGRYEVLVKAYERKRISFVCSLDENIDEIDGFEVIKDEKERLDKIVSYSGLINNEIVLSKKDKEKNELMRDLVINSDLFITYRPKFSLHTIIAGYPWFLDWGRDALISFEGLLLCTKRYDLAREILLMFTRDIKYGLIPNGYSGFDSRPLYNSVDSSLLLFEQVQKYLNYTGDYKFVKANLYNIMKNIIKMFKNGINIDDSNIFVDTDGLVSAGTENTQLTWMDVKIANFAVTPRNGKAVEINALWYNALKITESLAKEFKDKVEENECKELAKKVKNSFRNKFYNKDKKCLFDVIGDDKVRPNQLFAIALTYPVITINTSKAQDIFNKVSEELITKYGIATLSKKEKEYVGIYDGDSFKRDMTYHQGVTWPWLTDLYVSSYENLINAEKDNEKKAKLQEEYNKYIVKMKKTYTKALYEDACIGNLSEIYDSKKPFNPRGTTAQAWSLAMFIKLMQK